MVGFDQKRYLRMGQRRLLQILQESQPVVVAVAAPVQIFKDNDQGTVGRSAGYGLAGYGLARCCLGTADFSKGRVDKFRTADGDAFCSGFGGRFGGQVADFAPGEKGLGGEHDFADRIFGVEVGDADVIESVLHGVGGDAALVCPLSEGVRPFVGVGGAFGSGDDGFYMFQGGLQSGDGGFVADYLGLDAGGG